MRRPCVETSNKGSEVLLHGTPPEMGGTLGEEGLSESRLLFFTGNLCESWEVEKEEYNNYYYWEHY